MEIEEQLGQHADIGDKMAMLIESGCILAPVRLHDAAGLLASAPGGYEVIRRGFLTFLIPGPAYWERDHRNILDRKAPQEQ